MKEQVITSGANNKSESSHLTLLDKKKLPVAWSNELEDVIKTWGERAIGNQDLHYQCVRFYKGLSHKLTIPLIFLNTITSVTTLSAVNNKHYAYWMYAAGAINLTSAMLVGMTKYLKPEQKCSKHAASAKAYGKYYRKIMLELGTNRSARIPALEFSAWTKKKYDHLVNEAPYIPAFIVKRYRSANPEAVLPEVASLSPANVCIRINRDATEPVTTSHSEV